MIDILINQISVLIDMLKNEKEKILNPINNIKLTKTEQKIYNLLSEGSLFSTFGLSNEEIIEEAHVSKRSLIYCLNKFRKEKILIDNKIGRITYHKIMK